MEIIVVVILEREVVTVRSKTTPLFPGCEEAELQELGARWGSGCRPRALCQDSCAGGELLRFPPGGALREGAELWAEGRARASPSHWCSSSCRSHFGMNLKNPHPLTELSVQAGWQHWLRSRGSDSSRGSADLEGSLQHIPIPVAITE